MSRSVTHSTTRYARVVHSGRNGLTIAHIREFLADCEAIGIPVDTQVRVEDKLAMEGGNRSGYIEARHTVTANREATP